jgi:hypothetical protein
MPQASEALRAKFPGDDAEALEVLVANFTEDRGVFRPKIKGYQPTQREAEALDYLWLEWDYAYEP